MSYAPEYASEDLFAADAVAEERAAFIRRTYLHLAGAVLAFIFLEFVFITTPAIWQPVMGAIGSAWWLALIGFMIVSWVAQSWAHNAASPGMQYMGLGLYTVAEAVIFIPIMVTCRMINADIIPTAGLITLTIFGGLTAIVFVTKADFSFMRNVLWVCTLGAVGLVIASCFMPFTLGLLFTCLMIMLFAGWILYDTSNVLHHYRTDQHVGAALELFASLATLFWYVLRLALILSSED